ncbi:unnamed protein product [Pedinophyceae sp. YPF-701]|nr:unnamed protein product [Pedinophyceae sp. YPF-701]
MAQNLNQVPDLLTVRVTAGPCEGEEITKQGRRLRVGRTSPSEVCIRDGSVSEKHAVFEWNGAAWVLRDVGSSNGTLFNGAPLAEGCEVEVRSGDRVVFGGDSQVIVEVRKLVTEEITVEDYYRAEAERLISLVRSEGEAAERELVLAKQSAQHAILEALS